MAESMASPGSYASQNENGAGAAVSDILTTLRAATAAAHDRLDCALPLTKPTVTVETVRHILRRLLGLYEPIEARMAIMARPIPTLAQLVAGRRKVRLLNEDLRCLGETPAELAAIARCDIGSLALTTPTLFGTLYVIEGATLGGRLIAKHLEQTIRVRNGRGYSFFLSYRDRLGQMWRSFIAPLRVYDTPATRDGIVQGAVDTFQYFEQWLLADAVGRNDL